MKTIVADIKNSGKRKWLLLIPVIFLALLIYSKDATRDTLEQVMLQEKYIEIQDIINILGDAVDASTVVMPASESVRENTLVYTLRAGIESLDSLDYIYGALFIEESDGRLTLLSKRIFEPEYDTQFDVTAFPEFLSLADGNNEGKLVLPVYSSILGLHDLHVFFRFTPSDFEHAEYDHHRFLLVGGVSKYSIQSPVPVLVYATIWIMIILTVLLSLLMIFIMIRQAVRVDKIKTVMTQRVSCAVAKDCPLHNQQ